MSATGESLAAVFVGTGRPMELRRFPTPVPAAGEAVLRIECCTLCGSDMHTIAGKRKEPTPSILGHEILGVIESVGSPRPCDVDGVELKVGDRVIVSLAVSCGSCDRCWRGLRQKCRSLAKYGHEIAEGRFALSGGLAERLLLRKGSTAVRIDPAMPSELACPAGCAAATVAAACRAAGSLVDRRVLIFGAGMLGLTAAAFAKTAGAKQVTVCDVDTRRLAFARKFGVDDAIEWSRESTQAVRSSFDAVFEMSGSPDAVEAAVEAADVGGSVVLVGSVLASRPAIVDPEAIVRRWLVIRGVHNYAPMDLKAAVEFLAAFGAEFPFSSLVAKTCRLSDIQSAIEAALEERPVRIAVRP